MQFPHLPVSNSAGITRNFEHLQKILNLKIVTKLPADTVDGQEVLWVTPGNGAFWRFRYWAGSPNAEKWMFVGGLATLTSGPAGSVTIPAGIEEKPFVAGPSLTIPMTGIWFVNAGAQIILETEGLQEGQLAVRKNGATLAIPYIVTLTDDFNRTKALGLGQSFGFNAGDVLTLAAKSQVAAARQLTFTEGLIQIEPVRMS